MEFTREISRLMFGLLLAFFLVIGSSAYWAIVGADTILLRGDNPRLVEDAINIERGSIYDRETELLVENITSEDGTTDRAYYAPSTYSVVGYFSFRYGTSGVENAYDDYLRGDLIDDTLQDIFREDVLHIPQAGADIRLTLDVDVQQTIVSAMGGYRGAVVVLSVPDGEILGLASLPTFDPNTLDADWETLVTAEDDPFFNRVLQGQYQPGGMLQTPLMVAGILTEQPFDVVTDGATRPILIDDRLLGCAVTPPMSDLTYTEAYAFGCPFPFSLLARQLSPTSLQNIFSSFRLNSPPIIEGFVESVDDNVELTPEVTPELNLVEDIVGQGELTINPLGMATIAGAVVNAGNAPQPIILESFRLPDGTWQPVESATISNPLMTANAARRLRTLMAQNVLTGASAQAAIPSLMPTSDTQSLPLMGGHTALAISGDETQSWFIGYAVLDANRGVAVAVVLENTSSADEVARIGGLVLESAINELQNQDG